MKKRVRRRRPHKLFSLDKRTIRKLDEISAKNYSTASRAVDRAVDIYYKSLKRKRVI